MKRNKRRKHTKAGVALMLSGVLLVACALVLVEHNIYQDLSAGKLRNEILEEIESKIESIDEDYVFNPKMEMPTIEINGYLYVGTLSIPLLDLNLPVLDRWDDSRLKISPCRYMGSVYDNDMIIAAHNYRSHFGKLKDLKIGDEITFTDVDGNVFNYVVSETELLDKTAIEEMESGGWDITLFTCTPGGAARVTIRCTKID
ncbi:MAG: sortase [Oscillospiraceae bacterium]|nr:sortase [Oscillospiraceae bacterium]